MFTISTYAKDFGLKFMIRSGVINLLYYIEKYFMCVVRKFEFDRIKAFEEFEENKKLLEEIEIL